MSTIYEIKNEGNLPIKFGRENKRITIRRKKLRGLKI